MDSIIEKFSIPAVGGIIEGNIKGNPVILVQTRIKNSQEGTGYLEIPAGKIREYENVFDCLRREVKEETGLNVVDIIGEPRNAIVENEEYQVMGYEPFYCAQNLKGVYPIMVQTFLCKVDGEALIASDESENIRWITIDDLKEELKDNLEQFYPMHVGALKKYLRFMDV